MSKKLNEMEVDSGPEIYYSDAFRDVIEDHMSFLRTHTGTVLLDIEPTDVIRFNFDLTGLLHEYSVPEHLHWTIARMNDYPSVHGFGIEPDPTTGAYGLLMPDSTILDELAQLHSTAEAIG